MFVSLGNFVREEQLRKNLVLREDISLKLVNLHVLYVLQVDTVMKIVHLLKNVRQDIDVLKELQNLLKYLAN